MAVRRKSPHMLRVDSIEARQYFISTDGNIASLDKHSDHSAIRFNSTTQAWQFSNNGLTYFDMGSGTFSGSSGVSKKYATVIPSLLPANSNFTLDNAYPVTTTGDNLDVFLNGQLLSPRVDGVVGDYSEIDTVTIQFHFDVPKGALLTYIIYEV